MATLKDPLSTLKIQQNKVDNILNDNQTAGRGSDAKSWLQNWRYERGIPKDSGVMPSVDEVPLYYRPYLFPRADASSTDTKTAAFTQKQMDGLNKVFPGAEGRINDFRKKQFNMGPMKIKQGGPQLPDLASDNRPIPSQMNYVTEKGWFLDGTGKAYQQRGGVFGGGTDYNPDIHGLPVPLVKNKDQNLAWLKSSGSGALTNKEFKEGLRIINTTSPNESVRNARELLLIKQASGGV